MNGVHDLGGMHGFGPVEPERNEPVFHYDWERRTFALALSVMGARLANVDEFRRTIERMPPAHYLDSSYYEHWLYAIEGLLKEKGVLNGSAAPAPDEGVEKGTDATADDSELWPARDTAAPTRISGSMALRHDPKYKPRFTKGDRIVARNFNPQGHTRAPRYVRGRRGMIALDWGTFVFPDAHAHGLKAKPQHCYSVEFTARELWGKDFPARDRVFIDLWEGYLDPDESVAPKPDARKPAVRKPAARKPAPKSPRKKNERRKPSGSKSPSSSGARARRARSRSTRTSRPRPRRS